jgi:hypothetical protein
MLLLIRVTNNFVSTMGKKQNPKGMKIGCHLIMTPTHFSCVIRCVLDLTILVSSILHAITFYHVTNSYYKWEDLHVAVFLQSYKLIILQTILSDCIASVIWNQNPSRLVHVTLVNKVWAAQDEKHPKELLKKEFIWLTVCYT